MRFDLVLMGALAILFGCVSYADHTRVQTAEQAAARVQVLSHADGWTTLQGHQERASSGTYSLRARFAPDAVAPQFQLIRNHRSKRWFELATAVDVDGADIPVVRISRDVVPADQKRVAYWETVGIPLPEGFIVDRHRDGFSMRLTGAYGEDAFDVRGVAIEGLLLRVGDFVQARAAKGDH